MKHVAERSETAADPRPSRNPLTRVIDSFWNPTPASLRLLALLGVIGNALIVASGGAVRVTKSGLGCPEWPRCSGDSLVPTHNPAHSATNMAIEFGNRMITFVVLAIGVLVFIAALRLVPRRKDLVWWALAQPMAVVAQAVIGGIVVLTKLHPAAVALHFLFSPAMLIFCVALYERSGEGDTAPKRVVQPLLRALSALLAAAAAAVLVAGTVVTGSGPHAGDDKARRWGFEIENVTRVHSGLAWITVALTVLVLITAFRTGAPAAYRRRVLTLVGLEVAQGALGYIQYFMGVPGPLVVLHMAGSVLVWITALRILFATRDRGPMPAAETRSPATSSRTAPQPA